MKKLLIVSNRLPFKLEKKGTGIELKATDGGLVTAMKSLSENPVFGNAYKMRWIGSAGFKQKDWDKHPLLRQKLSFDAQPVFLNNALEKGFYNGFSNSVIWPLFHYFPSYVDFNEKYYDAYESVNKLYAEAVAANTAPGDIIWIHDYHFMLLPKFLRAAGVTNKIGFFLHIPFPSYELFRLLPQHWRENMLTNLLEADLLGFQTSDYASHFRDTADKCLRKISPVVESHKKVRAYPIGIDFEKFNDVLTTGRIKTPIPLHLFGSDKKVIFSVDRLDYTKGVMNRLEAYEKLLEENPAYTGKIVFILNVVPSRDEIGKYRERKKMIEESIGRINGKLGNVHWQPIIYQYRHLSFAQLTSFYRSCHVALVTPMRDGMNLVAKEFVASRTDERGVLVLSDMAGAANSLKGALLVTPTDTRNVKEKILEALEMPAEEQQLRMRSMRAEVQKHNVLWWATNFIQDLSGLGQKTVQHGRKAVVV